MVSLLENVFLRFLRKPYTVGKFISVENIYLLCHRSIYYFATEVLLLWPSKYYRPSLSLRSPVCDDGHYDYRIF